MRVLSRFGRIKGHDLFHVFVKIAAGINDLINAAFAFAVIHKAQGQRYFGGEGHLVESGAPFLHFGACAFGGNH